MDLTNSYARVLPADVQELYDIVEVRDAAAVIAGTNPQEWQDIIDVLRGFRLRTSDILVAGGNEGDIAKRLNDAFRSRGWREGQHDQKIISKLKLEPYAPAGEVRATVAETEVDSVGYKVDNVKGAIALDVEWNAKDGNLDRDLSAYATLYGLSIIRAGVIITRTIDDLRALGASLGRDKFLSTTTTTNLRKLEPRMARGSGGGCPVLAVAITARTYQP